MNNKIEELAEQSRMAWAIQTDVNRECVQEFVEAIIQECLHQCDINSAGNTNFNEAFNEGHSMGVAKCYYQIKKHFGIL